MVKAMDKWYALFTGGVFVWFMGFPGFLIVGFDNTREIVDSLGGLFWAMWFVPIAAPGALLMYADLKAIERVRAGTDKTENKAMAEARAVIAKYLKVFDGRKYVKFSMSSDWLLDAHMSGMEFLNMIPKQYKVTRSEHESRYIGRDETLYLFHVSAELMEAPTQTE